MVDHWILSLLLVLYFGYGKNKATIHFCRPLWILSVLISVKAGSYFERAKVPKFTMEGESREQFLLHWQAQAVSNLMAAKATQLQKYLTAEEQKKFESCCQKSNDFHTYVECFKPVWTKGKLLRRTMKKRRRHRRSDNYYEDIMVAQRQAETVMLIQRDQELQQQKQLQLQQQWQMQQHLQLQQQQALATQRSPIGEVADWLTGFIQTIKEPKVIVDGKFRRPSDKPKEKKIKSSKLKTLSPGAS